MLCSNWSFADDSFPLREKPGECSFVFLFNTTIHSLEKTILKLMDNLELYGSSVKFKKQTYQKKPKIFTFVWYPK